MKIVVVHRAASRGDAALVVDALERHGINAFVQDPTHPDPRDEDAPRTIVRVWVRAEDADDANALLDAVGHHLPASLDNPPGEEDAASLA